MSSIQFYHLTSTPLEKALPRILEKAYAAGMKSLVLADSEERIEMLNNVMWTYAQQGFLPHGSAKDGNAERQPIYLSTEVERPNGATLAAVTDGRVVDAPEFERVLDLFDGQNEASIAEARKRWKHYKDAGHSVTYFQQTPQGGWEEKRAS